jgi:thioredoxin 1
MTSTVEIISRKEFEKFVHEGLRLVVFTASWSRPCREQYRNVERIGKNLLETVPVALVDVEKLPLIASEAVIQTIPTCVVYRDRKEILRLVGLQREETLRSIINKVKHEENRGLSSRVQEE